MSERTPGDRIVIVGASLAGLTTAEALRDNGFAGDVLLIGAEPHLPYSRPPLSKQVLSGDWTEDDATLRTADELAAAGIRTMLGLPATSVDLAGRTVAVGGEEVPFDILVIATGVAARTVRDAGGAPLPTLRTRADARALAARIADPSRVLVLGAGVLGSEIASGARAKGSEVTLVSRGAEIGFGAVGRLLSSRLVDLHRAAGVDLRLGTAAVSIDPLPTSSAGAIVTLSDGARVGADLVVAAVGGHPATEWLRESGLDVSDGVVCDDAGRAAPGVFAVGDVARWTSPTAPEGRRVEHQTNAIEQALAVGRLIATGDAAPCAPTLFWSQLHRVRIQAYGDFDQSIPLVPHVIDPSDPDRLVLAAIRGDQVTGIVGWNAARAFRDARTAVDDAHASTSLPNPIKEFTP